MTWFLSNQMVFFIIGVFQLMLYFKSPRGFHTTCIVLIAISSFAAGIVSYFDEVSAIPPLDLEKGFMVSIHPYSNLRFHQLGLMLGASYYEYYDSVETQAESRSARNNFYLVLAKHKVKCVLLFLLSGLLVFLVLMPVNVPNSKNGQFYGNFLSALLNIFVPLLA
jgi:hypothetical protein